jgi:lipopolysaccharide biosynthesis regulator YciM
MGPYDEQQAKIDDIKLVAYNLTNHKPTEKGVENIEEIRNQAKTFATLIINLTADCYERRVATDKLQEVVFWANAAIARYETEDAAKNPEIAEETELHDAINNAESAEDDDESADE